MIVDHLLITASCKEKNLEKRYVKMQHFLSDYRLNIFFVNLTDSRLKINLREVIISQGHGRPS